MHLSALLLQPFRFLLPPAIIGTLYLYFYPFLQQCAFPAAKPAEAACFLGDEAQRRAYIPGEPAPFRLLALADPQLEGDTSLPNPHAPAFPALERAWMGFRAGDMGTAGEEVGRLVTEDLKRVLQGYRKRLDLWGNDLYLSNIYRSVHWYTDPTHVVVLGDLLGSQWIGDEEFERRRERFWDVVFTGAKRVPWEVMDSSRARAEVLGGHEGGEWKSRIMAVAGNHDVGYAGDLDGHRVERFERAFGRVNWEVRFRLNDTTTGGGGSVAAFGALEPSVPELRLVVLNSMNLDEPAKEPHLQQQSRDFLDQKLYHELPPSDTGTILLTHIPLHKKDGVCIDAPFFSYFDNDAQDNGIKEQNHLSEGVSQRILDGIVGPGRDRSAIILNGHDHAGCDVYHSRRRKDSDDWEADRFYTASPKIRNSSLSGIRELTVRSMMGEFGGNAGLLSAWWDEEERKWKFDYMACICGVQHIWWAVHVLDLIVCGFGSAAAVAKLAEEWYRHRPLDNGGKGKKKMA